jgi:hypothetical protein
MSFAEQAAPRGGDGQGRQWPGQHTLERFTRSSPTLRIPRRGKRPLQFATDRVRAAPALTPTLSGTLGLGAIGLGWWGLLAPKSVSKFLGVPAPKSVIRMLLGVRELYTGYSLAGDPTKSEVLWLRVAGDVFGLMVLGAASNPKNPKRHNARFMLKAVLVITALDVIAAVRMTDVQRNCTGGAR